MLCRRQIRLVRLDIFELLSRITPDLLVIRRWLAAVPVLVLLYSPSYSKRPSGRCRISRNRHGMMCMWIPYESNECMFTALSISGRIMLNFGVPRLRTSPHFLDFQKFSVTYRAASSRTPLLMVILLFLSPLIHVLPAEFPSPPPILVLVSPSEEPSSEDSISLLSPQSPARLLSTTPISINYN